MASVEPGANPAIWRSVAALASLVRYIVTPVETTTAGRPGSKPAAGSRPHQDPSSSKSTGTSRSHSGTPWPSSASRRLLPLLRTGPVDLEYPQTVGELRPALGEGVQARAQDHVLADTAAGLLGDQILDEPRTGHDGRAVPGGGPRVHVRAAPPAVIGVHQAQADLVLDHVRRRVGLDVHRPPQRHPYGGVVRRHGLLARHGVHLPAGACRLQRRPSGSRTVISRVP